MVIAPAHYISAWLRSPDSILREWAMSLYLFSYCWSELPFLRRAWPLLWYFMHAALWGTKLLTRCPHSHQTVKSGIFVLVSPKKKDWDFHQTGLFYPIWKLPHQLWHRLENSISKHIHQYLRRSKSKRNDLALYIWYFIGFAAKKLYQLSLPALVRFLQALL